MSPTKPPQLHSTNEASFVHDQTGLSAQARPNQTSYHQSSIWVSNTTKHYNTHTCRPRMGRSFRNARLALRCRYSTERILPLRGSIRALRRMCKAILLFNVPSRYFRDIFHFIPFLLILASKRTVSIRRCKLNHCTLK
jgi:hypothetical protein